MSVMLSMLTVLLMISLSGIGVAEERTACQRQQHIVSAHRISCQSTGKKELGNVFSITLGTQFRNNEKLGVVATWFTDTNTTIIPPNNNISDFSLLVLPLSKAPNPQGLQLDVLVFTCPCSQDPQCPRQLENFNFTCIYHHTGAKRLATSYSANVSDLNLPANTCCSFGQCKKDDHTPGSVSKQEGGDHPEGCSDSPVQTALVAMICLLFLAVLVLSGACIYFRRKWRQTQQEQQQRRPAESDEEMELTNKQ